MGGGGGGLLLDTTNTSADIHRLARAIYHTDQTGHQSVTSPHTVRTVAHKVGFLDHTLYVIDRVQACTYFWGQSFLFSESLRT